MADGGMVALDVRRRKAVAGCRATWPDQPGYAGALRTVPPTLRLDSCGSTGVHLADCRRALLALENLTL